MDKEKIILTYMEKLNISREEAEQLFEDDNHDFIGEDGEKMTANAKVNQHREKSDNKRKSVNKKRKVDADKKHLFDIVKTLLLDMETVGRITDIITKTETEISFEYNNACYTWKLTKHKAPK